MVGFHDESSSKHEISYLEIFPTLDLMVVGDLFPLNVRSHMEKISTWDLTLGKLPHIGSRGGSFVSMDHGI